MIAGLLMLAGGVGLLSWCAVSLGAVNPGKQVPGRLPVVQHPTGYMPVGALGIGLVICGAMTCRDSDDPYTWLIATVLVAAAIGIPFATHNHRLPR